jgi:hypothetical protein
MGLFGRLFGAKPAPQEGNNGLAQAKTIEVRESVSTILDIPALNFFGPYNRSPHGRYALVWRDGSDSRGGSRTSGEGRYVMLDGKKLVADGAMERPNDGRVADNGTFILNDWRFSSDLSGVFWAFRFDGSLILSRSFSANLFNNRLSADGTVACCQTCDSASEDSAILAIFDLVAGTEISTFSAESGCLTARGRFEGADGDIGQSHLSHHCLARALRSSDHAGSAAIRPLGEISTAPMG